MVKFASATLAGVGLMFATLVVVVPLPTREQACFGAGVLLLALLMQQTRRLHRGATLGLMAISIIVSVRYLYFRITSTLPEHGVVDVFLGRVLLCAELYAFTMLVLGYLQSAWPLDRRPVSMPQDPAQWPTVDVFIPTYNEPLRVVAPTILAASALDWPHDKLRIYVLDDGCRPEFKTFAESVGVRYFDRAENTHAKAGNINKALGRTQGEFVAIFDCDHIPTRSFLQVAMGWVVRDPKLAMVQTPHHFYSPDPFERNLGTFRKQPNEGELFYGLIQRGNDLWNAAFFCGSCAVLRRSALEEIGGIAVETVTEDAHTALRLQRRGHHTAYLPLTQAGGLATESLAAHIGQRQRWARGMAQIFRIDNPLLGRGLSLGQRLCYAASMLHFLHALPRLVFLLSPLSYLFFEAQVLRGAPLLVLSYSVPHLLHSLLTNSRSQGRFRLSFWSEVYECALAPFIVLPTTLALLAPHGGRFNVTRKGSHTDESFFDLRIALPHVLIALANAGGIAVGAYRWYIGAPHLDVTQFNMAWAAYNLLIVGTVLAVASESRQRRTVPRVEAKLPVALRLPSAHMRSAETRNLSLDGANLVVERAEGLEPGTQLKLCILSPRVEAIPARVVARSGHELRLRFDELSQRQQRSLVEAVFCRADTWLHWTRPREADQPAREVLSLGAHAVRGLLQAALAPFTRKVQP